VTTGASQSALAASPTAPPAQIGAAATPDTLLVRDERRGYRYRNDDRDDRRRYRAGHRYHEAPRHWRRYHSRPRDWNTRGCIIVGPLWFCP
jgi:hypothetical protein